MRLLLVDDDPGVVAMLAQALRRDGYSVDTAATCDAAEALLAANHYDLVILDWILPDKPGIRLCEELRTRGRSLPVLFVSVQGGLNHRVAGLEAGADDYLTKPFHVREFLARVHALLRRASPAEPEIRVADLVIDTRRKVVQRRGAPVPLTATEYQLVEYLARNAERVVTRSELTDHVWDDNHDPASHALEVHINHLRSKLRDDDAVELIHTRRGLGYVFGVQGTA
jgi:DNA-binding response OmpR family regulator